MFGEYNFDKQAAFKGMEKRGIAKIEIEFSGGHDDGGIDSLTAFDKDGNEVKLPEKKYYITTRYSRNQEERGYYESGDYQNFYPLSKMPAEDREYCEFIDNLHNIVYSKYYTFAGEFYVHGTATIDAVNKTANIDGQETVEQYEDFTEVL